MDEFMDYLHENAEKMNSEIYKELNEKILKVNNEMKEIKAQTKLYRITLLRFEYTGIIQDEDEDGDNILTHTSETINIILPENHILAHCNYQDDRNKFNLENCRKKIGQSVRYEYDTHPHQYPRLLYELGGMRAYNYINESKGVYFDIPYVPYRLLDIQPL